MRSRMQRCFFKKGYTDLVQRLAEGVKDLRRTSEVDKQTLAERDAKIE